MNKFLIQNPIITEKALGLGKQGKYIFLVKNNATAQEAKKVIEAHYKVKVIKTHVINIKSKQRRMGALRGQKSGYKKIIVTLKPGQKLDFLPQ